MSMKKHLHIQKFRLILALLISTAICVQAYAGQQDANEPEDLFEMSIEEKGGIHLTQVSLHIVVSLHKQAVR